MIGFLELQIYRTFRIMSAEAVPVVMDTSVSAPLADAAEVASSESAASQIQNKVSNAAINGDFGLVVGALVWWRSSLLGGGRETLGRADLEYEMGARPSTTDAHPADKSNRLRRCV
jgi:hypothetical protein